MKAATREIMDACAQLHEARQLQRDAERLLAQLGARRAQLETDPACTHALQHLAFRQIKKHWRRLRRRKAQS